MQDAVLSAEETSNNIADEEESWAQKLMYECEQELLIPILDTPYIYVEKEKTTSAPVSNQVNLFKNLTPSTAIERQIQQQATENQVKSAHTKKVSRGFLSLFRTTKSTS